MSTKKIQIIGGFPQPDWAQNDAVSNDYIKNRPFYTEGGFTVAETIYDEVLDGTEVNADQYGWKSFPFEVPLVEGTLYRVTIDDKEYDIQCEKITGNEIGPYENIRFLGNIGYINQMIADIGEDFRFTNTITNVPFVVTYNSAVNKDNGAINIGHSADSYTVSIQRLEGSPEIIHKLDPKFYERLAWEEKFDEVVFDQNLTFSDGDGVVETVMDGASLISGEKYNVKIGNYSWDVTAYSVAVDNNISVVLLGNEALVFGEGSTRDLDKPFVIGYANVDGEYALSVLVLDPSVFPNEQIPLEGEHRITITHYAASIKKIDEKFLPDSVPAFPDYAQNDSTQPDYIKNRTHWIEDNIQEVIPEMTFSLTETDDGINTYEWQGSYSLDTEKMYSVNWNGTTYKCVAQTMEGVIFLGNLGILTGVQGVEPFIFMYNPEEHFCMIGALDGSTTATVSIAFIEETIHHLDSKYIEDMYGTIVTPFVGVPKTVVNDYITALDTYLNFIPGETYIVTWDDVVYELVAIQNIDGNFSIGAIDDNGYIDTKSECRFAVISIAENQITGLYNLDQTNSTFSIADYSYRINKIDEKYMPAIPVATETALGGVKVVAATEDMTKKIGIDSDGQLVAKPYELPTATEEVLGGVKAITATEGMTVKVGISEDGRLVAEKYELSVATEEVLGGVKAIAATSDMTEKVGIDTDGQLVVKPSNAEPVNYFLMTDAEDGFTYVIEMRNGNLVSSRMCAGIKIVTPPDKVEYLADEVIDITGMVVEATYEDGSVRTLETYTYSERAPIDGILTVTYTYGGRTVIDSFDLTVRPTPESLVDFEYIENEDGTYTLTEWKGTFNGEESTEIIIPNNSFIIV